MKQPFITRVGEQTRPPTSRKALSLAICTNVLFQGVVTGRAASRHYLKARRLCIKGYGKQSLQDQGVREGPSLVKSHVESIHYS